MFSCIQNLVEFRHRSGEIRSEPFSGATCACQKTLLGLPVCPSGAHSRPQALISKSMLFEIVKKRRDGNPSRRLPLQYNLMKDYSALGASAGAASAAGAAGAASAALGASAAGAAGAALGASALGASFLGLGGRTLPSTVISWRGHAREHRPQPMQMS